MLIVLRRATLFSLLINISRSSSFGTSNILLVSLLIFAVLINLVGAHLTIIRLGYYNLSRLVNWLHNLSNFYYLASLCRLICLGIYHRMLLLVSIHGSWLMVRVVVFIWHLVVYLFIRVCVSKVLFDVLLYEVNIL